MKKFIYFFEQFSIAKYLLKWFGLSLPVALSVGSMVALFLYLLDWATRLRWQNPSLLFALPLAGLGIVGLYQLKGKNAEAGNNLILDEIHSLKGDIPTRMSFFILLTTIVTHLFGGSAGREGTAVQIGGSLSNFIAKVLKINKEDTRILLLMGISAGFGAVFGTPIAGTIFALEVLAIGRIKYDALLPCFFAGILADLVCSSYGIKHTHYAIHFQEQGINLILLLKVMLAGIVFGLVSYSFSELSNTIKNLSQRFLKNKYLIVSIGGVLIIGLSFLVGDEYLGLGVTRFSGKGACIVNAFQAGGVDNFSWLWKLLFTAITLSTGFKGGEVTPLFFIGAALGNTLAVCLGMPVDLLAGLGFIAVFAGATNTPLACTLMGVELFGGQFVLYYAVVCFLAYYFSGHTGIYSSQKISESKANFKYHLEENNTLKKIREHKISNLWKQNENPKRC